MSGELIDKDAPANDINTQEKLLERVRALIAKADGTDNPNEADAFRAKADALMLKYGISSWELKDANQNSRTIVSRDVDMSWYSTNPHADQLWGMMQRVMIHCRVVTIHWQYTGMTMPVVGTEQDLDYADLLFTNIMLEMSKGLEPKPSRSKEMIENLVMMKEAGMKWERIGELLISIGQLDYYDRSVGVRFTKMYTDYCDQHGRPRLRIQPATFQHSFAKGFEAEMKDRLFKIKQESMQQYKEDNDAQGMDLVLADIKSAVDAKARQLFGDPPRQRGYGRADNRKVDGGAFAAGAQAAKNVNLGNKAVSGDRRRLGA